MHHNYLVTPLYFADTYNCGAYGAGAFDQGEACQSAGANVGAPNTGFGPSGVMGIGWDLVIVGGFAVIVLTTSIISLFRRRKNKAA